MQAGDCIYRKRLEQPVLDYLAGTGADFFGRLEDQRQRAVELAVLGEVAGRGEQDRRVPVMALGVHGARISAREDQDGASSIGCVPISARIPMRLPPAPAGASRPHHNRRPPCTLLMRFLGCSPCVAT